MRPKVLVGLVLLVALALVAGGWTSASTAKAPVVIGMVDTLSGSLASNGTGHLAGAQLAAADWNKRGGVLGRPIKIVAVDDMATPAEAARGMQTLSDQGVTAVLLATTTPSCRAGMQLLSQLNQVAITPGCSTNSLTSTEQVPNFFRTAENNTQIVGAAVVQICKLGVKTVDTVEFDFVTADTAVQALQKALGKCGVTVANRVKVPLTVTDIQPYIQNVLSSVKPNSALFTWIFGSGEVALLKQGGPVGLFSRYKATYFTSTDFDQAAAAVGSVPPVYSIVDYFPTAFKTPVNIAFVKNYKALHGGDMPGDAPAGGYRAMTAMLTAIAKAKSTDASKIAAALRGLSFNDIQGKLTIGKFSHQVGLSETVTLWSGRSTKVVDIVTPKQLPRFG